MRTLKLISSLTLAVVATFTGVLALAVWRADAGVPLPLVTFYGMLVDEFGWPYHANVDIEVSANGTRIYSKSIKLAEGQDYNFLFRTPYDSGSGGPRYSSDAISLGDQLSVKIVTSDTRAVLVNTNFTAIFPPGAVMNVNLSAGTDSVGDGLPDELRRWIWFSLDLNGPFNPAQIRAGDDSDGDGVSNLNEYRAGTDPANVGDVLRLFIDNADRPSVRQLTFYTVPGKGYQIQSSKLSPGGPAWETVLFASSPGGAATNRSVTGTGHFLSVFVPTLEPNLFYRISVSSKTGLSLVP